MKTHELKIHPVFFEDIIRHNKRFEIRRDDRGFESGDLLRLDVWSLDESIDNNGYTGDWCEMRVTYVARNCPGLADDYCIMSTVFLTGKWFE